ncbi:spondin domain-containing protein [Aerosakkonemataceae cyanobacterium BLCC-F154]|uniref:Spondin domain-containing protein n=1 Tax=Floridaenema fluviatile BLCC-F154 TaxID=3153640 RepID=A0ABV4YBI3_9CYAN
MALYNVTVSVENLAPEKGTFLTPLWFGFHNGNFDTYDRGRPVSPGLESLAEDGATDLISQEFDLSGFGKVQGTITGLNGTPGPIDPGETTTFTVQLDSTDPTSQFFNYASMIIPSNDFFIANGNERAHRILNDEGKFINTEFTIEGNQVLDAGTEVNDELPENTAFFGQQTPNTGLDENGVALLANGFKPGGNILSDPRFANADFTTPDYQVARIKIYAESLTPLDGSGGNNTFTVPKNSTYTIANFGGIGRGIEPNQATLDELDTIKFVGEGLTAKNLILFQNGDDLELTFDGKPGTKVILSDFAIENLDNLVNGVGNILFDGDTTVQDSFDIINVDANPDRVFSSNTVTFLNGFDNEVEGFNNSDDVINGQRGDDTLRGLSGDDLVRGLLGDDVLFGDRGADTLIGGLGDDKIYLGRDRNVDKVIYRDGDGSDVIYQFRRGHGGDILSFQGIDAVDVVVDDGSTWLVASDGISGNADFGSGELLAKLEDVTGFTADNISQNLAPTNMAQFLFA